MNLFQVRDVTLETRQRTGRALVGIAVEKGLAQVRDHVVVGKKYHHAHCQTKLDADLMAIAV